MYAPGDIASDVRAVLERFCAAFTARDPEAVMRLFAGGADVVMVTSESWLLRGPDVLRSFLEAYQRGPTVYSWLWDEQAVSASENVAWLCAEGTETAVTGTRTQKTRYRVTLVCERRDGEWRIAQFHGSSPREGPVSEQAATTP